MEITLIRTGGIIPITKKAKKKVDIDDEEMQKLVDKIKAENNPGAARDATAYQLNYRNTIFPIDISKVPKKHRQLFEELKENLKIEKQ